MFLGLNCEVGALAANSVTEGDLQLNPAESS